MSQTESPRRLLVTGAGGFIGRHAIQSLAPRFDSLIAMLGPGDAELSARPENVESLRMDLCEITPHALASADLDCVIHMAGPAAVAASHARPAETLRAHALGTARLLECLRGTGLRRIVYVSSAEVYGQPESQPVDECAPLAPRSPYAIAKLAAEQLVRLEADQSGCEAVILRPFVVYGPGMRKDSLIGSLVDQSNSQSTISVFDASAVRDYCFVDDFVRALWASAVRPLGDRVETFNVGSGRAASVPDLVTALAEIHGRPLDLSESGPGDRPLEQRIVEMVSNSSRARALLDWTTEVSLVEGIRATVNAHAGES